MAFPNRPPPNAAMALGSSVPNPELPPPAPARKAKKQAPPPRAAKKAPGKKKAKKAAPADENQMGLLEEESEEGTLAIDDLDDDLGDEGEATEE